jgi:lysine-specific demethylase/histidyl-hydroxylase NO66
MATTATPTPTPTAPTRAERGALSRCISPVENAEFLDRYWEQKPLVVRREEASGYDDLLSLRDVDRLICSSALRYPAFRLVREGDRIDARSYTGDVSWRPQPFTGTIDVDRVLAEFQAGATIVLQALHHWWQPLAAFCRGLETALGHPSQANAYFTPRSAQGLAVHHDTHDVFVLQIAGEKHWRVYEPVLELPLKDQHYSRSLGEPGPPVEDVVLRSGDAMYLPRGWLHDALTRDAESLHLTIGVNVYTRLDALKAALDECAGDVEFRRSVGDGGELGAALLERLGEQLGSGDVTRRRRERLVSTRRPIRDGQLAQLRALESLTLATPLERRPTALVELDFPQLSFEGKTITFPEHVGEEVEFVTGTDSPFTAAELPGDLDEAGRLVLVRRLVREGLLVLHETTA